MLKLCFYITFSAMAKQQSLGQQSVTAPTSCDVRISQGHKSECWLLHYPATFLLWPGEAAEGGPRLWDLALMGPAAAVVATWGVNEGMENVCLSPPLIP